MQEREIKIAAKRKKREQRPQKTLNEDFMLRVYPKLEAVPRITLCPLWLKNSAFKALQPCREASRIRKFRERPKHL
jgi:hypothetical protein